MTKVLANGSQDHSPLPLSFTDNGLVAELLLIVRVPFCLPTATGLKVTLTRHDEFGGSIPQALWAVKAPDADVISTITGILCFESRLITVTSFGTLVVLIATLPNFSFFGLTLRRVGTGATVGVAVGGLVAVRGRGTVLCRRLVPGAVRGGVAVRVRVAVAVLVRVAVRVRAGVADLVRVAVAERVRVGVRLVVAVRDGIAVGVEVRVVRGVGSGVGVCFGGSGLKYSSTRLLAPAPAYTLAAPPPQRPRRRCGGRGPAGGQRRRFPPRPRAPAPTEADWCPKV